MGIIVVDQSPELFWFVRNALIQEELAIKQVQTIEVAQRIILHELPEIVILNADDKGDLADTFINQMRNQVFARHTVFIVFTSNTDAEFKISLLMAGATQIFYRGQGFGPSLNFFAQFIKWSLNHKSPHSNLFDFKTQKFEADARLTNFGRLGWISSKQCLIETNISLNLGQSIDVIHPLFEELNIKNVKLKCIEKNKVGRYYQYAHSLLCSLELSASEIDARKLDSWIKDNAVISKNKSIKLVYFDHSPDYRDNIRQMIKVNKDYCARGYNSLKEISEVLEHQVPQLILINRGLIQRERSSFEKIKKFLKNNFSYCITYSTDDDSQEIEKYKKNFDFAMHVPRTLDIELLESMIKKLKEKMPQDDHGEARLIFNKYSPYSRITLECDAQLKEMAIAGLGIHLPFEMANFSSCLISCNSFTTEGLERKQFLRTFSYQKTPQGIYHRMIFMGQSIKDNNFVRSLIEKNQPEH